MVFGNKAFFFGAVLQQREFRDPQYIQLIMINQAELFAQVQAQMAQSIEHDVFIGIRNEHQNVAHFGTHAIQNGLGFLFGEEFDDRALQFVFLDGNPRHALCAVLFYIFYQGIQFSAGKFIYPALYVDAADRAAVFHDGGKHFKVCIGHKVADFAQFQAKACIGLVRTETVHRLFIRQPAERHGQIQPPGFVENALYQLFVYAHHIIRGDKGHFKVHLGEFRLAVCAQVFISKAADDLEITIQPGDHQKLFEHLRRLRQRIEFIRLNAAGHQIFARAFRRALGQHRCFDF